MSENLEQRHRHSINMLFLITTPKLALKAEQMFEQGQVRMVYRAEAKGTAPSEIMDTLGLTDGDKCIITSLLPKVLADEMLKKLRKELQLGLAGTGVAFTIPLSGANSRMLKMIEQLENTEGLISEGRETKMEESGYALIIALVDRGYSEEVMEAARSEGSTGGTVLNTRWVSADEEAMSFWGVTMQAEKEIVMILASHDDRLAIMRAIGKQCGATSEAHGMVMSLPVDSVIGLD